MRWDGETERRLTERRQGDRRISRPIIPEPVHTRSNSAAVACALAVMLVLALVGLLFALGSNWIGL